MGEVAIRLKCSGEADGANVYINKVYKGMCPADIFVPGGNIKLKVSKPVGKEKEKTFEKVISQAKVSQK